MQHLVFPSSAPAAVPGTTPPPCEESVPRLIGALAQLRDLDGGLTARRTVSKLTGRPLEPRSSWVALMDIVVACPLDGTLSPPLQLGEPRSVWDQGDRGGRGIVVAGGLPP